MRHLRQRSTITMTSAQLISLVLVLLLIHPALVPMGAARAQTTRKTVAAQISPAPGGQTFTLLPDGRQLVLGGVGPAGALATAMLREGSTMTPIPAGLAHARAW